MPIYRTLPLYGVPLRPITQAGARNARPKFYLAIATGKFKPPLVGAGAVTRASEGEGRSGGAFCGADTRAEAERPLWQDGTKSNTEQGRGGTLAPPRERARTAQMSGGALAPKPAGALSECAIKGKCGTIGKAGEPTCRTAFSVRAYR